jgi:hypothetical protein
MGEARILLISHSRERGSKERERERRGKSYAEVKILANSVVPKSHESDNGLVFGMVYYSRPG